MMKKNNYFRQITKTIVAIVAFLIVGVTCGQKDVFAFSSVQYCLDTSGGRSGISSVQWACNTDVRSGVNSCSLWIGSGNSESYEITALSGTVNIGYYGMCTRYPNTTAHIWVSGDNDSIGDSRNLWRGNWGSPGHMTTTLNIGRFINGANSWTSGDTTYYSRTINIKRQHGGTSSTSSQDQTLTLIYKNPSSIQGKTRAYYDDSHLYDSGFFDSGTRSGTVPAVRTYDAVSYTFTHSIKGDGDQSTTWHVYQCSSGSCDSKGTEIHSETFNGSNNAEWSNTVSVGPGEKICQRLEYSHGSVTHKSIACVSTTAIEACANPEVGNDISGQNYSKTWIKNAGNSKYTSWQGGSKSGKVTIWGKPTDVISFQHCYYPQAQKVTETNNGTYSSHSLARSGGHAELDLHGNYIDTTGAVGYSYTNYVVGSRKVDGENSDKLLEKKHNHANRYQLQTDNSPMLSKGFSVTELGPFSPNSLTFSGSSSGFFVNSKLTSTYSSKTTTDGSTVLGQAAGKTITQKLKANVGTNRVQEHTWNYRYWYRNYCYRHSRSGTPADCYSGTTRNVSCYAGSYQARDQIAPYGHYDTEQKKWVKDYNYGPWYTVYTKSCSYDQQGVGTGHHDNNDGGRAYWETSSTAWGEGSSASINIPYNFRNVASASIRSNTTVYAGENFEVASAKAITLTRYNALTEGTYHTIVPQAELKLWMFYTTNSVSGQQYYGNTWNYAGSLDKFYCDNGYLACQELTSATKDLNSSYLYDGDISTSLVTSGSFAAYDLPAGYSICIGMSVSKADSADDANMNGSGQGTFYSAPDCRVVSKKPSFSVWGGNVNSNKTVSSNNAALKKYSGLVKNGASTLVFGSWSEFGLTIKSGSAINFASGTAGVGGNTHYNFDYCNKFQPLTIANANGCVSTIQTATSDVSASVSRKVALLSYYGLESAGGRTVVSGSVSPGSGGDYYSSGNITINTTNLTGSETTTIFVNGTATIAGNIERTGTYTTGAGVPNLVIYAKNGINVTSNVSRIDALLITDKTFNSCAGSCNAEAHQLIVNGPVIAGSYSLPRTYGAGPARRCSNTEKYWSGSSCGNDTYTASVEAVNSPSVSASAVSSEIFNYSVSSYLWAADEAYHDNQSVYSVYQTELAPRE